jgi:hypothetical protein
MLTKYPTTSEQVGGSQEIVAVLADGFSTVTPAMPAHCGWTFTITGVLQSEKTPEQFLRTSTFQVLPAVF